MKKITLVFALLLFGRAVGVAGAMAGDIQPTGETVGSDRQGNAIRQVSANGIKIGYKLIGSGKPVIMIQGMGATMGCWPKEAIDILSNKHQLILPDNRGVGYTTSDDARFTFKLFADDVIGLLDALGVKKANVLGYSMGSAIAQELLLEHPERFDKAIIIATITDGGNVAAAMNGVPDNSTIGREIEATTHWKTPLGKLPFVANRVIIMVGTADAVVGVESSKVLASSIPGARLVQLKDRTHHLIDEAPAEVAGIVSTFLDLDETIPVK